jgi:hypothetical protein
MTLLGGAGTFFGPFVGAGTYLGDRLAVFTERWPLTSEPLRLPSGWPGSEVPIHYVPSIEPVPPA